MTTLRYKLLRIGGLSAEMRSTVEREGLIHLAEGVPVGYSFSGHLPGLVVIGTNTRTYSGAVALTRRRILATLSVVPRLAGRAVDHEWAADEPGPLQVEIDERGVRMAVDVSQVDPDWSGRLALKYRVPLPAHVLAQIPSRSFSLNVPREWVLRLAGVPTGRARKD